MKKICVVIGSRANYSSIKSAMWAIQNHPKLQLQLVVGASAILDRYGSVVELIEGDGFKPDAYLYMLVEGENPVTMAKSTGLGLIELPTIFSRLRPDIVVTVGDRFETMATTLAAAYMNIPVAHTMGGEVTGTIDESIRHAVTKFAHIHFPASAEAKERIIKLGEKPETIFQVGCPRIDLVSELLKNKEEFNLNIFSEGVGAVLDLNHPFLLVSQHPVTTEYGEGEKQITETLHAIRKIGLPTIVLWPNADAGSEDIVRGIRKWREQGLDEKLHFFKNLPIEIYIKLMDKTACLIGNSSSGIREGAFIGTPVVNIGSRQAGRENSDNVLHVPHQEEAITNAIEKQLNQKKYQSNNLYGDGHAGEKMANIFSELKTINIQKQITY